MNDNKKTPTPEPPINELSDQEQLDILFDGSLLLHSDFTIHGSDTNRIRRILIAVEKRSGIVTEEDFKRAFKSKKQLAAYIRIYGLEPQRLGGFVANILAGEISLSGGQEKKADHGIDLLGLFTELTERFKFPKQMVYEALAERLKIQGHDSVDGGYSSTDGAEKVRQTILKLKKQLR